ncbi:MAG TPA: ATP-binding cassette domain-containing protein [Acidimicrobiales bacterium]
MLNRSELRFAMGTGTGILAFLVVVGIIYPAKPSVLFFGLITGSLSGLIAIGLVLVYRANRIVNFAQGDMGGAAAILAASLIVGRGWSFFPAAIAGLVFALVLGALTEIIVIRRFKKAPRLQLTVATIGLAQLFQVVELVLPKVFNFDTVPQPPEPFKFSLDWAPITYRGGHLLILLVVPLAGATLAVFLRRSRFGIGIRAAAESTDRAALLGIPVQRLNTVVWMLASGLSGLAVVLRMPIQGVAIGSPLGPALLLRALAAAVIGRMESLPKTIVAALVLGMVSEAVFFASGNTIIVDAVLFGVIIGALLFQRGGREDRARDIGASSWRALREVRPIPRELMRLPEVRIGLGALSALAGVVLLVVPLTLSKSQVNLLGVGLIFAMVMCSLVVLTGWAGQISLGQLAIMAFGGAVAWTLSVQGKDFFVCVGAAALVGMLVSIALGIPALRIKGPFLAVTTLAFALTTGTYFLNNQYFPWLVPNISERLHSRPVIFGKFDLESDYAYYYVILAFLALVIASVWRVRRSRTGRVLIANRDNTRAAQSYGISPVQAQLVAFGYSGFIAGLAGGLYLFHQHQLSTRLLDPAYDILVFSIGVLGGLSSIAGALLAAAYLYWVNYSPFTKATESQLFASGVGLLVIMMIRPDGLGGAFYSARDAVLRRIATLRHVVVPSLLADVRVVDEEAETILGDAEDKQVWAPLTRSEVPDDPLLLVRGLEVAYDKTQVLFGIDFHVARGEIVALLGTNGAGKSTLLSAVCGLVKPSAGKVTYDGKNITGVHTAAAVGDGLVLMPGGKGVFPTLTVEENLRLASWVYVDDPDYVKAATDKVLEFFPVLRERWDQRAGNLSGGEQQMLTLGQAFIARPKLLLIDELSLGLAPIVVEQLLGIVRAIHESGTTVVLVEQSVNLAITLAQRAVFLEKGEVRFDGPTAELLERPELLRAVFLEGAGPSRKDGEAATPGSNGHAHDFVAECDHCGHEHKVALELREVTANFGGVRAVNAVDLSVRDGQIIGIIGPNGAGKTTVLDIISGFVTPSSGDVRLDAADVTALSPDQRARLGLGRSFQDARLFSAMTVRDTIATAFERHVPVPDAIAAIALSPAVKISERAVEAEVERLIALMRLEAYADKFVGELSTGTRRIVDLACVLAHRPSVLLLDEPSSGIAQRETEALGPVLLDIRRETGAAMVVIEHDMPLITSISDELVALELGAVVAHGIPSDVINNPRVVEGYLGTSEAAIRRSGSAKPGKKTAKRPRRREPLVAQR